MGELLGRESSMMVPHDAPSVIRIPWRDETGDISIIEVPCVRTAVVRLPDGNLLRIIRDRQRRNSDG